MGVSSTSVMWSDTGGPSAAPLLLARPIDSLPVPEPPVAPELRDVMFDIISSSSCATVEGRFISAETGTVTAMRGSPVSAATMVLFIDTMKQPEPGTQRSEPFDHITIRRSRPTSDDFEFVETMVAQRLGDRPPQGLRPLTRVNHHQIGPPGSIVISRRGSRLLTPG
jgi:hypothetical protein